MDLSLPGLLELIRYTIQAPRLAARMFIKFRLPRDVRWLLFALVVAASSLLTHIGFELLPKEDTAFMAAAMTSPIRSALLQAGLLLTTVAAITYIGRMLGGTGNFSDVLLLVGWLQFILLCLQLLQIVALLVFPPVAEILGVFGLGLTFWLLTQFTLELHGFQSAWRVFLGIVAVLFAAAFALSLVLITFSGAGG